MLKPIEVQRLENETAQQGLPDVVQQVDYLVFAENDENLNDTVEEYARDNRPDLIAPDDDHFTDGHLIVAVGYDPQMNGVYCGNDVCDQLDLWSGKHLNRTLESAKDFLRDKAIASGLLASVAYAGDEEAVAQDRADSDRADKIALGVGGGFAAVGLMSAGGAIAYSRRKKKRDRIEEARSDYDYVMKHYADTAQRLDEIDIRAHSLTSPLANAELRKQWADVRDRFLELDNAVQSFRGLSVSADDDTFHEHYAELNTAEETTLQVKTAEQNIETIYQVEHGDEGARLELLNELKSDLLQAETTVKSDSLRARVTEQISKLDTLRSDLSAPNFLEQFVVLLGDVSMVLATVDAQEFSDVDREADRTPPAVYDTNYRVGTGVNNYVPFYLMASWHDSDVQAHQAAESSANTSFSSGFSGGGGSSSF
ncbi:DUF5129 domain-containing protein [Corynebacterium breve]|uniref:DUF5129 domain-containing protein n=1 Tax=Corynebacterium breve TaxID=3049799 RepID=A0ABY8VG49_9CORY|nr:DUF5129 domain-containing protein [Corynebacterium breve]WIM68473.1 DUF5129 domain-containing protein [Corynebacterium breve]